MATRVKEVLCIRVLAVCVVLLQVLGCVDPGDVAVSPAPLPVTGPLRVDRVNPRYFSDPDGRVVYLTGSHNWMSLMDFDDKPTFDYGRYLDFLQSYHHNFMRLWTREGVLGDRNSYPFAFERTGPGTALDSRPTFDVSRFNPTYFDRLRNRVQEANARGIYVMVMLFHGFSIQNKGGTRKNPWPGHPFNAMNNENGINGDPNGNGEGEEVHTLAVPEITRVQEAYVRKVIDTVNDLAVLYEISNESGKGSAEWQYHMIRFVQDYEKTKPRQNPVVMTFMWDGEGDNGRNDNELLLASPADAIAPGPGLHGEYRWDPPPATGRKVIISDTDHLWGVGGDVDWAWKSFLRGLNPIFMDPIEEPQWDPVRRALGQTLTLAKTVNLGAMVPRSGLASSGYCLAAPGVEYLVYLPSDSHWLESRLRSWMESAYFIWRFSWMSAYIRPIVRLSVKVDLTQAAGPFLVTWFNPSTGTFVAGGETPGGREAEFSAPFTGAAVLRLTTLATR
jgi:hypothetical protein